MNFHHRRRWRGLLAAFFLTLGATMVPAEDRAEWQQPERVMRDLCIRPGSRVADVGCGRGFFALRLAESVGRDGFVYAVDIDTSALADLRKQAERQHLTNVAVVVSEPTDARLPFEGVDAVLVCNVLHEMPAPQRLPLVQSAVRGLKPGGFLHLIDYRKSRDVKFDPYEKLIPREDLIRICTDAGLRMDAEFHYLKYQVFLRFWKPSP